ILECLARERLEAGEPRAERVVVAVHIRRDPEVRGGAELGLKRRWQMFVTEYPGLDPAAAQLPSDVSAIVRVVTHVVEQCGIEVKDPHRVTAWSRGYQGRRSAGTHGVPPTAYLVCE